MNLHLVWHYAPSLTSGFGVTVLCWGIGSVLGLAIGFVVALASEIRFAPLRWLLRVYIEIFRGTPFLMQLFILYDGGPFIGLKIGATTAGILGLGLYSSAYYSEIFRGGLASVPRGQIEAAMSVGMTSACDVAARAVARGAGRRRPGDRKHPHRDVEGNGGTVDHHRAGTDVSGADHGGRDLHRL